MYEIPKYIEIERQPYAIRNQGDFRMVLDCFSALEDEKLTKQERLMACLIIFYEDMNSLDDLLKFPNLEKAVSEMFLFFNCGEQETTQGPKMNRKLVDWEKDSQLISAAINKVAGKEIRGEQYIHWWTFMGYYIAIGDSLFSTVISIRDKIIHTKKLEKHEREFKLRNPQYFIWNYQTVEQREANLLLQQLWNKGK